MSISYVDVTECYDSLGDAIVALEEQLLTGEDAFRDEQRRVLDQVAPGPDPFMVIPSQSSVQDAPAQSAFTKNRHFAGARHRKTVKEAKASASRKVHPLRNHPPLGQIDPNRPLPMTSAAVGRVARVAADESEGLDTPWSDDSDTWSESDTGESEHDGSQTLTIDQENGPEKNGEQQSEEDDEEAHEEGADTAEEEGEESAAEDVGRLHNGQELDDFQVELVDDGDNSGDYRPRRTRTSFRRATATAQTDADEWVDKRESLREINADNEMGLAADTDAQGAGFVDPFVVDWDAAAPH